MPPTIRSIAVGTIRQLCLDDLKGGFRTSLRLRRELGDCDTKRNVDFGTMRHEASGPDIRGALPSFCDAASLPAGFRFCGCTAESGLSWAATRDWNCIAALALVSIPLPLALCPVSTNPLRPSWSATFSFGTVVPIVMLRLRSVECPHAICKHFFSIYI